MPWRRKRQPTAVFLPRESHGQTSLVGYSPWGHKELDTNERLTHIAGLCAKHHSECFACIYSFHPHNPMKYHLGRYKYHPMVQRRCREAICLDLQPQQPEARSCALALVFGLQANSYTRKFQYNHGKLPGIPPTGLRHLPLSVFPFSFPSLLFLDRIRQVSASGANALKTLPGLFSNQNPSLCS